MNHHYKPFLIITISIATLSSCATHQPSPNLGEKLTCEQHAKVSVILNNWAANTFDETYGKNIDTNGANVQLFLIQEKAPSPYAMSFNRYEDKAIENIALAKKKGCDISTYLPSPIDEFKKRVSLISPQRNEK